MTTQGVIFDNEWVLVQNDWEGVATAIAERLDVPLRTGKDLKQCFRLYNPNPDNILYKWNRGHIERADFWGQVLENQFDREASPENINTIADCMSMLTTDVNPEMIRLVQDLKDSGYLVLMLSNSTPEIERGNRERHDYFNLFPENGIYMSFRTGARKPEPEAFRRPLREHKLIAERTPFVDDKPENLEGAKSEGLIPIDYKMPAPVLPVRRTLITQGFTRLPSQ